MEPVPELLIPEGGHIPSSSLVGQIDNGTTWRTKVDALALSHFKRPHQARLGTTRVGRPVSWGRGVLLGASTWQHSTIVEGL